MDTKWPNPIALGMSEDIEEKDGWLRLRTAEELKLRAALQAVEWVEDDSGIYMGCAPEWYCPWCNEHQPKHARNCQRQEALGIVDAS